MMSFCMVAAQGVTLPIAIFVGRNADRLGRRPIFLVAFAVLPIRSALYVLSDNAFWLLGVQFLDGIGAGIYEALTPLLIADVMRGTGRYNLAQGGVATTQGIGASVSALAAGATVDHFGYTAAFLLLAGAAALAFLTFFTLMPEARDGSAPAAESRPGRALQGAPGE
jgi:MFS family permease